MLKNKTKFHFVISNFGKHFQIFNKINPTCTKHKSSNYFLLLASENSGKNSIQKSSFHSFFK